MPGERDIKVAIKQLKANDVPNARVSDMNIPLQMIGCLLKCKCN